jgi:hypothetical protein
MADDQAEEEKLSELPHLAGTKLCCAWLSDSLCRLPAQNAFLRLQFPGRCYSAF